MQAITRVGRLKIRGEQPNAKVLTACEYEIKSSFTRECLGWSEL